MPSSLEIYQRNDQLLITCSLKNSKISLLSDHCGSKNNSNTQFCIWQQSTTTPLKPVTALSILGTKVRPPEVYRPYMFCATLLRGPVRAEIVLCRGLKMTDHRRSHSVWQSLRDPQGRMAENSKFQACKACWVKPKKTRGCNYCQRGFFKGHYSVKIMTVGCW